MKVVINYVNECVIVDCAMASEVIDFDYAVLHFVIEQYIHVSLRY